MNFIWPLLVKIISKHHLNLFVFYRRILGHGSPEKFEDKCSRLAFDKSSSLIKLLYDINLENREICAKRGGREVTQKGGLPAK